jgi:hypothetical protein
VPIAVTSNAKNTPILMAGNSYRSGLSAQQIIGKSLDLKGLSMWLFHASVIVQEADVCVKIKFQTS